MSSMDISAFASKQLELLDAELQAELVETAELASNASPASLQRAGLAILNLSVSSQRTGFGGKTILELSRDPAVGSSDLPEHGLHVGDIVGVREQVSGAAKKKEKVEVEKHGVDGVVTKTTATAVGVALDKNEVDVPGGRLWIIKLANDVTYKRMSQTMTRLSKLPESSLTPFIRVLFGQSSPTPVPQDPDKLIPFTGDIQWISQSLNPSQKNAIRFALASPEIALIHGPPGTGKTHTLIELILQLLHPSRQNKDSSRPTSILVCGPSNISVDNIVERLAPHKVPMVRLGHPARLLPSVLNHSLDVLTKTSDAAGLVQNIRAEIDAKATSMKKMRSYKDRKALYAEMLELRKDCRRREEGSVAQLVQGCKVVLATLHGAGGFHLKRAEFDVVIIDEASQALEAQCWVPLLAARKAVLAGDHLQLPPTVKSVNSKTAKPKTKSKPKENGEATSGIKSTEDDGSKIQRPASEPKPSADLPKTLETTLFDRLLSLHGTKIKRILTTQYRMHASIMAFPSTSLYACELKADPSVASHLLTDLKYDVKVTETEDTMCPLVFYDTHGGLFPEKAEDASLGDRKLKSLAAESKSNENEALLVLHHVKALVEAGVHADDIAVITPYNAQLAALSTLLKERFVGIELGSVDGFQGREKEAVVLSLVRSNQEGEVGFLGERRRLNVAMTRPRRHLCVIGDSETVGKGSEFLISWMQHLEEHADLRYPDPSDLSDT